jgi:hypothetical protein
MRTTLNLDDDVLLAIRELSEREHISYGQAVSSLIRRALTQPVFSTTRNGVPIFPRRNQEAIVTMKLVNQLRDETF